jgi:hypothetical protein
MRGVDWLPTLAGMVGASKLVPKDRPIDSVDASAFMEHVAVAAARITLAHQEILADV